MSFTILPPETSCKRIVPYLDPRSTYCLTQVSAAALEIVQTAATLPQEDITLAGKCVIILTEQTISGLLRHKLKMDLILNLPPPSFDQLNAARLAVSTAGNNPDDIAKLLEYADHNNEEDSLAATLVLFNLDQIPSNFLEKALKFAVKKGNLGLIQMILSHPNAAETIPANSFHGLGSILDGAVWKNNPKIVQMILSFPNAQYISADSPYTSLGTILKTAVESNNPEIVQMILSHPDARNIPADALFTGIGNILKIAVESNNLEIVQMILSHPNARDISANESFPFTCLGAILKIAVKGNNPEIVQMILSHPNAQDISAEILNKLKGKLEKMGCTKNQDKLSESPAVEEIVISSDDHSALGQLKAMLEQENANLTSVDYLNVFAKLSWKNQQLVCELLCKASDMRARNILTVGTQLIRDNPKSLLPIINQLM